MCGSRVVRAGLQQRGNHGCCRLHIMMTSNASKAPRRSRSRTTQAPDIADRVTQHRVVQHVALDPGRRVEIVKEEWDSTTHLSPATCKKLRDPARVSPASHGAVERKPRRKPPDNVHGFHVGGDDVGAHSELVRARAWKRNWPAEASRNITEPGGRDRPGKVVGRRSGVNDAHRPARRTNRTDPLVCGSHRARDC